jgi:hypothetical protein
MYIGSWKIAYLALSNNYSSDLEISNFKQHIWCCLRIKMSLALMLPFKWHSHPSMSKPFLWTYICCFHMSVLSKTTGVGVKSGVMIYIIVENLRQRFGSRYCHLFGAYVFIEIPRLKSYVELSLYFVSIWNSRCCSLNMCENCHHNCI